AHAGGLREHRRAPAAAARAFVTPMVEPQRHRDTEKMNRTPPARRESARCFARRFVPLVLSVSLCLCGSINFARAVTPEERLADPALEARARAIGQGLRCLVCQNQSIDDSNAELAHDLRVLVRERLVKGESDRQVIDFVASRYGDYVLLKPPVKPATW